GRLIILVLLVALLTMTLPTAVFAAPPQQGGPTYHVVQRGETLGLIARRYGVTVTQLVSWNNIRNPDFIQIGQRLIVGMGGSSPASQPTQQPAASGSAAPATDSGMRYGIQAHMIHQDRTQIINATKGLGFNWL